MSTALDASFVSSSVCARRWDSGRQTRVWMETESVCQSRMVHAAVGLRRACELFESASNFQLRSLLEIEKKSALWPHAAPINTPAHQRIDTPS